MSFYRRPLSRITLALLMPLIGGGLVGCTEADKPANATTADPHTEAIAISEPEGPPQPDHLVHPPENPRIAVTEALDAGLFTADLSTNDKLRAMLEVAGVPEASQVLVFSKTSLQLRRIGPSNPRAIYFNDNCYIGYVPGGLIEYGDADPNPSTGSGLFAVDPNHNADAAFVTDASCLSCHEGARTNGRAGFMVRSIFPDPDGHIITSAGSTNVSHDTPLAKRWGGWYVTGDSGAAHHRGNQVTIEHPNGDAYIDNALGSNLNDLSHRFNVNRYLQPTSDIVALMVLEHQVQMHNLLTQGRSTVYEQYERSRSLAKYLEEPFEPENNETLQRVIKSNADRIVKHLLYSDELALTDSVTGSALFIDQFRANRKEDSQGRSLKDFDLQTRMFKYRCSYMVYSQAFDYLPKMLKDAVLDKVRFVLSGQDDDAAFDHLGSEEREAIRSILQDTGIL